MFSKSVCFRMDDELEGTDESEERTYGANDRMMCCCVRTKDKQLVSLEYPGIVQNVENAIETLGGSKAINKCLNDENKRMELRFRPKDLYCKPAFGSNRKTTGMVLRVRRRKKQSTNDSLETDGISVTCDGGPNHSDDYDYKVDILGLVSSAVRFEGMSDFQYLPTVRREDGSYENIYDKLVMTTLTTEEEYCSRDAPLFLNPVMFSRFETPHCFMLKETSKNTNAGNLSEPSDVLTVSRRKRRTFTQTITFADPTTPMQANAAALAHVNLYKDTGLLEGLTEMFEERPIWSRSALCYRLRHLGSALRNMKFVLPTIAYFFLTGPWRLLWVKLGYDPRKDPSAKKFQNIDFRQKESKAQEARRVMYLGRKKDSFKKLEAAIEVDVDPLKETDIQGASGKEEPQLRDFEFHADVLPPNRQMNYMLCDIFEPEVQALAAKNDGKEKECDERNGWGVANFTDRCRKIMTRHIDKLRPDTYVVPSEHHRRKKKKKKRNLLPDSDSEDTDVSD